MKKKILIDGMSCNNCVKHITEVLSQLHDPINIEVDLEGKYALVETTSSDEEVKEKIEDIGYDVIGIENI